MFISSPDELPKVSQGVGLYLKPTQDGKSLIVDQHPFSL